MTPDSAGHPTAQGTTDQTIQRPITGKVFVTGGFFDLSYRDVRFLHEASRFGDVHVLLWPDRVARARTGGPPRFRQTERLYFLRAVRYVADVRAGSSEGPVEPETGFSAWVADEGLDEPGVRRYCSEHGLACHVIPERDLAEVPADAHSESPDHPITRSPAGPSTQRANGPATRKVLVTGCFDWLHSGHVRFFEEASRFGELYVVVGHDANLRLLKGEGHPLFPQEQRRYMVGAIRYVHEALVSTGRGWMDAAPEIDRIEPDIYLVNEDGDRPEKRAFCRERGLEYVVLKRRPRKGLPARQSTDLRGF